MADSTPPWLLYSQPASSAPASADSTTPPWMLYGESQSAPAATPGSATPTGPAQNLPMQPWSGGVLPVSSDSEGKISFDPKAGLLGSLWSAATLPGDVYQGKADPNTPEGFDRTMNLAATISPMGPIARVRPAIAGDVAAPSATDLKAAATQGYNAFRDSGAEYVPQAVSDQVGLLRDRLWNDHGINETNAPKAIGAIEELQNPPPNAVAVPAQSIEIARRSLGQAGKDFSNQTEQLAARKLRDGLENFASNPPANAVPPGKFDDAVTAAGLLSDARDNYAASKRSQALSKIESDAELDAKVANSGLNLDNTLRRKAAAILKDPEKSAGFSDDELSSLREVAMGTPTRNAARWVSNLLGGGGGLGAVAAGAMSGAAGGAIGGPLGMAVGAVPPAVGLLAKKWTGAATEKALNATDELVRQRSPAYQGLLADAAPVPVSGLLAPTAMKSGLLTMMNDPRRRPMAY